MLTPVSNEAFKAASNEATRICAELNCQDIARDSFPTDPLNMGVLPTFQRCSDHLLSF